ncbi:helix-turn-helix domain-containing protein [Paenibacillus eucommiae]|uniref:AraC-like DNA-binding protein n=1 Tax=Paenibacillus eucommiae TaxID=1355755 RepID=A0ABS4IWH7_9BACL|nr:helix-turn-helix domain-containing protein [Paenibacillus eucommiae]MBP1991943.1 AraC-like DNA-binding protein [Paenibacillus eucommiae]
MKIFKPSFFYRKKYYLRIVFSISFLTVILIGALTMALYIYGKQTITRIESQSNMQVLNQVRFNFELMDSTIKNAAKYLFVNPDTTALLNATGNLDYDDIYNRLNRVTSSVIASNSFIHSIGFYNEYQSQYYYAGKQMYYDDTGFKQMIADYPKIPRMKPIFRLIDHSFGDKTVNEKIITYLLYQDSGEPAKIDYAVVINVNANWIRDNLDLLHMVNPKIGESVYIYSDTSGFLDNSESDESLRQSLLAAYGRETNKDQSNQGSFEQKLNMQDYVISYQNLKEQGLTIFKIRPSAVVYQSLHTLSIFLWIIFVIFVLVALFFSILVSGIVYNPIQKLVRQVTVKSNQSQVNDEILFLSSNYDESINTLKKYDVEKKNYHALMKTYFIKNMLLGEGLSSRELFEKTCEEYKLKLIFDGAYCLCLVQIDEYERFQQSYNQYDRNLLKYALFNVFTESYGEVSHAEVAEMHDDDIVLMLPCGSFETGWPEALEDKVQKAQHFMLEYYKLSVTVSMSPIFQGVGNMPGAYKTLLHDASYRFFLGHGSFITPKRLKANKETSKTTYSQKLETALLDNIQTGNLSGIKQSLGLIQAELKGISYEHMTLSFMHLLNVIRSSLIHNGKQNHEETGKDILKLLRSIGSYETIEECFAKLISILNPIVNGSKNDETSNQSFVLETAYNMIKLTYPENTLCADFIATQLKIHPRRLAKIFKDGTGMSIADCINEVRMKEAAALLENSNMNVYDIIFRVGYENESYFYKLFKSRYGITPKEYANKFRDGTD